MKETVFRGRLRREEGFNLTVGLEAIGNALDVVRDTACNKAEFDRFANHFLRLINVTDKVTQPEIELVFGEPIWLMSRGCNGLSVFETGLYQGHENGIRLGAVSVSYLTKAASKATWNCWLRDDSAAVIRDGFLTNIMTGKALGGDEIEEGGVGFDGLTFPYDS